MDFRTASTGRAETSVNKKGPAWQLVVPGGPFDREKQVRPVLGK